MSSNRFTQNEREQGCFIDAEVLSSLHIQLVPVYFMCFFFNCVHAVLRMHLNSMKLIHLESVQSVFCMQFELQE